MPITRIALNLAIGFLWGLFAIRLAILKPWEPVNIWALIYLIFAPVAVLALWGF